MGDIEIIPTCVPESIDDVIKYGGRAGKIASAIHLDINDGILTPDFSWPFVENGRVGDIDETVLSGLVFEAHLMVSDCREIGSSFINIPARSIVVHVEARDMGIETLQYFKSCGGGQIGIAILLDTPLEQLNPLLPFSDFVQVMSVATIGAQGASFDPRALERVERLHKNHPDLPIQVDGGISRKNITNLARAGARRFAVGAAIATAINPAEEYAALLSLAQTAL
ncbi:MAG TPA: hypothetical protein VMU27_01700 [Candidatus Paceibacterota bacterium]|nr:hypothetical protein [Candidatus Paceibacterota bacterium]